ncbi:Hypothetical_protein [Hexamita inflata]|uniref:Hypothetical_protein n=1 Tax=Hexamita inflata TaxID=28002 RepID=A0AA86NUD7_9EUKA|nr:Hypothetical protein HINF_LOCUS12770 [Hexamita inflata]
MVYKLVNTQLMYTTQYMQFMILHTLIKRITISVFDNNSIYNDSIYNISIRYRVYTLDDAVSRYTLQTSQLLSQMSDVRAEEARILALFSVIDDGFIRLRFSFLTALFLRCGSANRLRKVKSPDSKC